MPTRDRPEALRRCLAALDRQMLGPIEVVVVDDGSVDRDAVAEIVARSPSARLVPGRGLGPAAARNGGAAAANAQVLCFTDDDCEPAPDWAERLLAALSGDGDAPDAAVGRTVNGRPDDRLAAATQAIVNALTETSLDPATGRVRFGPSCNLAVRRDLFRDEQFDEGFPLAAGEDREWCDRLTSRGQSIAYVPEAIVAHRPAMSARGFVRQHHRYGRGAHRFRRGGSSAPGRARPASSPGLHREIVRSGFRRGPAIGALVCFAQVLTAWGFAREAIAHAR